MVIITIKVLYNTYKGVLFMKKGLAFLTSLLIAGSAIESGIISYSVLNAETNNPEDVVTEDRVYGDYTYCASSSTDIVITSYTGTDTEITVPSEIEGVPVTQIASTAFKDCTSLKIIELPESIKVLDKAAFDGCDNLDDIIIPKDSPCLELLRKENPMVIINDILIDADKFTSKNITIPDNVKKIGRCVFKGRDEILTITIPESVTYIGKEAFAECSVLSEVTINEGTTCIGESAFYECPKLEKVILPETLKSIEKNAFYKCSRLWDIPLNNGLEKIGETAFCLCENLVEIDIPDGLTWIGAEAFKDCYRLKTISIPESVSHFGASAFANTDWYKSLASKNAIIVVNNTIIGTGRLNVQQIAYMNYPKGVTTIGEGAFRGCKDLTATQIPDTVTKIEDYAFYSCPLREIKIPDSVTDIGNNVFGSCGALKTVYRKGALSVGDGMFTNCAALESITATEGITYIGDYAFQGCTKLQTVPLSENVTSIGKSAFRDCNTLTEFTMPESVKSIGDMAFYSCDNLSKIILPNSLTTIGEKAFYDCSKLLSLTIPENVTEIGEKAIGYYLYNKEDVLDMSFQISGYNSTAAEKYASDNKIKFDSLGSVPQTADSSGDVNDDGSLTTADIVAMLRYLILGEDSVNMSNADLNSDSAVNAEDYLLLRNLFLN